MEMKHNGPRLSNWIQTNLFLNHLQDHSHRKAGGHECPVVSEIKFVCSVSH